MVEVKVNVGPESQVGPSGPPVIVVSGTARILTACAVGVSRLPAASCEAA